MKKIKIAINKKGTAIALFVTLFTVIIDYISKIIVMKNMDLGQSIPLIKNILHITYITNPGAAFGSLSDARWLFMTASVIMIFALLALIIFWDDNSTLFYISVSMILGGGIGNMIDRIFYGEVVDFIDFCAFPKLWSWIFNLADTFVCVGVGLLILYYILAEVRNAKNGKEKIENGEQNTLCTEEYINSEKNTDECTEDDLKKTVSKTIKKEPGDTEK